MDSHDIRKHLQSFVGDGLVVIVGCGLSAAEGMPSMGLLARHLLDALPGDMAGENAEEWNAVAGRLRQGIGLEEALSNREVCDEVRQRIVVETAALIRTAEDEVINQVMLGNRILRFATLAEMLLPSTVAITVVTTNYDRLLELACEMAGLAVDSMFLGHSLGRLDRRESGFSFCRGLRRRQGKISLEYAHRIRILKPHGSLDWYSINGRPRRCPYTLRTRPMIIPPGTTKYRAGYDEPFDAHRELANSQIDKAARYLVIGYGFNDDHLQTHLDRNLRDGKQCLVLTRELTDNGKAVMKQSSNTVALTTAEDDDKSSVFHDTNGTTYPLAGELWDLGVFVKEVLT